MKTSYKISVKGELSQGASNLFNKFTFTKINDEKHGILTVMIGKVKNQKRLDKILKYINYLDYTLVGVKLK